MNNDEFFAIHEELNAFRDTILGIKGSEYPAGGGDRLSNFKVVAALLSPIEGNGFVFNHVTKEWDSATVKLDISAEDVAMVYTLKHVLSLLTFVRERRSDQPEREPIKGRIADIQNYGDLLLGLLREEGRAD